MGAATAIKAASHDVTEFEFRSPGGTCGLDPIVLADARTKVLDCPCRCALPARWTNGESEGAPTKGHLMTPLVVVAVNDSPSARSALHWAATWARATRARLRAVHVLAPQVDAGPGWYPGAAGWTTSTSPLGAHVVRDAFGELFDQLLPEPGWTMEFGEGEAGPTLIQASVGADLLVVGTRRLHGLARMIEGSVSQYVLRHATCPVLTVPADAPTPLLRDRPADPQLAAAGIQLGTEPIVLAPR